MAPRQDQQIEKLLDEALKQKRFQALEDFLDDKNNERTPSKCSKQFITKLDKFISRELDQKHVENACLGFKILHTFGCCLVFTGGEGLAAMVSQGIVEKMEQWFDKALLLWEKGGTEESDLLLRLSEDFFDALMAIHDSGKEGTHQVYESFLTITGKLASNSQVHISVQKEAVQKLNAMLCAMPSELRKERKTLSKEDSGVIKELADRILACGDYDLQAATLEAICRMTLPSQRREFVYNWFTMDFVASAFLKIRELQFETDCRKFLNMVNGMKGDTARVYSYPCLGVFLDQHELLIPSDELEEFWIDFNAGSLSLSFYCMLTSHDSEEPRSTWETFFLPERAVKNYSVDEQGNKKVLSVLLATPYILGQISGTRLAIHFSSPLNVLQAAQKVFGSGKNKRFIGKTSTSVVKTTVQIILDENSQERSQVLIPDSQISLSQRSEREQPALNSSTTHKPLPPSNVPPGNSNPQPANTANLAKSVTPHLPSVTLVKHKVSKSSTFILSSSSGRKLGGGSPSSSSAGVPASTPRGKVKPALQMVSSVERKCERSLRDPPLVKTPSSARSSTELSSKEQKSVAAAPVRPSSADLRPTPKKGHDAEKFRRHIPVDRVLKMVQTEEACAEEPLDDGIVPDTQPDSDRKQSSMLPGLHNDDFSKKKWSVTNSMASGQSSNLLLSTSKHGSGPKPTASVEQQPPQSRSRPPSAQRVSRELTPKQLHVQLTQKLEALVREREQQCTPGGRPLPMGSSRTQTPRTGPGKASQGKAVPVAVPNPMPPKPTPTKALSEETTNGRGKVSATDTGKQKQARGTPAAKGKTSEEDVTGNMVKFISSHYQMTSHGAVKVSGQQLPNVTNKRSLFDKSWSLNTGVKGDGNGLGFLKSFEMSKKASVDIDEDVYAFKPHTPGSIGTGGKKKSPAESSAISSSFALSASAKKAPQAKVYSRRVKKHLFSDTDTDRDRDNATDVSWLRDSARRPKPKVVDYGRQPPKPCLPPCGSDMSPDLDLDPPAPPSPEPPPSPKPVKEQAKPKRKRPQKKPAEKKPAKKKEAEQNPMEKNPAEKNPVEKNRMEKNPAGKNPVEKNRMEKNHMEKNRMEKNPAEKNPAGKNPVGRNPAGRKPVPVSVQQKAVAEPTAAATETRGRRPRRAATLDVSYRENSDQSEPEDVPSKKRRTSGSSDMTESPQAEVKKTRKVSPPPMLKKISPPQRVMEVSPPPKIKKISPPQKMKDVSPPLRMKKGPLQQYTKKVSPPQKEKEEVEEEVSPPLKKPVRPPQESWASRVTSSFFSPPSRERMRSAEKSPPLALSPATPLRPLCLSPVALPSATPDLEMPKSVHQSGINTSSFYKPATGGKDKDRDKSKDRLKTPSLPALPTPIGRTPSIASSRRSHPPEAQLPELSPVCSLHSPAEGHLTSTALERSLDDSPLKPVDLDQQLRDFVKAHEGRWGGSDKYSDRSMATLSQSSHLSANNVAILCSQIEKTPACNKGHENGEETFQSGPSYDRMAHPSQPNSCPTDKEREEDDDVDNDEEREEGVRVVPRAKALKMKPRKLFKGKEKAWLKQSAQELQSSSEQDEEEEEEEEDGEQKKVQAVQERKRRRAVRTAKKTYYTSQTQGTSTVENVEVEMSSHMVSSSSSTWKAGVEEGEGEAVHKEISTSQEVGYVCQEFSTELTRKFQKRSEKMELYNKQSLKTVQQHMSSISLQMRKHRTQRMEKVRQALLEEISSLEQDDNALKSMEKDLTIYWKKQSLAFHSYQERESRRLHHLKNTFQTNVSHSLEYEEQIISTEMCLMKKSMKSVQDKFLQEMREEELSSMRRGLQTLFLSGAPLF